MYGERGRLGIIVPSTNTVAESEFVSIFHRYLPDYSMHVARVRLVGESAEAVMKMNAHLKQAAGDLGTARVSLVAYVCTGGSFYGGAEGEEQVRLLIEGACKAPAITSSGSVLRALEYLRVKRIAVFTPYPEDLHRLLLQYLRTCGLEVVSDRALGVDDPHAIGAVDPEDVYEGARQAFTSGAQAVFLSCTNLRTVEVLQRLEEDLGVPAVSSNQATAWDCLKRMGVPATSRRNGRLLAEY